MDTLGFTIGKKFTFTKTFAESDVYLFAGLIGDFFPAHVNEEYCKTMPYGTRLVHGCLTFSLCSTVSGMAGVASSASASRCSLGIPSPPPTGSPRWTR